MSDSREWQAPGSGASEPAPPAGPAAPNGWAAPEPAAAVPPGATGDASAPPAPPTPPPRMPPRDPSAAPGTPGWTPPPRPGLVPLRPMTLGVILSASFRTLRRNPRPTLGPALVLSLAVAAISTLGLSGYFGWVFGLAGSAAASGTFAPFDSASAAGQVLSTLLVVAGAGLLSVAASALLQGIIVAEVARGTVGEKLRWGALWRRVRGRAGVLVGWAILLAVIVMVLVLLVLGLIILIAVLGNTAVAVGIAIVLFLLAGLGGLVLWAWLSTRLAFVPAAIVLERRRLGASIRRSWSLTRAFFWRTFGIQLLVAAMIYVASQVVSTPIALIATLVGGLAAPTSASASTSGMVGTFTAITAATYAVTGVVTAIGLVLQSATSALLYLDLRMRKEGLDLELVRFVEARAAGVDAADPYLPRPAG